MESQSENYLIIPPEIPDRPHDLVFRKWDSIYIWLDEMVEVTVSDSGQLYTTKIRVVDNKVEFYDRGFGRWIPYSATEFEEDQKQILYHLNKKAEDLLLGE